LSVGKARSLPQKGASGRLLSTHKHQDGEVYQGQVKLTFKQYGRMRLMTRTHGTVLFLLYYEHSPPPSIDNLTIDTERNVLQFKKSKRESKERRINSPNFHELEKAIAVKKEIITNYTQIARWQCYARTIDIIYK
jgi:hypothetical protein